MPLAFFFLCHHVLTTTSWDGWEGIWTLPTTISLWHGGAIADSQDGAAEHKGGADGDECAGPICEMGEAEKKRGQGTGRAGETECVLCSVPRGAISLTLAWIGTGRQRSCNDQNGVFDQVQHGDMGIDDRNAVCGWVVV